MVAANVSAAGFRLCVYDGIHCPAFGATTNVEGRAARAAGDSFLHLELSERVRLDPESIAALEAAIASAFWDFHRSGGDD